MFTKVCVLHLLIFRCFSLSSSFFHCHNHHLKILKKMGRKFCCFLLLAIQILSLVSATSRTFSINHDLAAHQPVTSQTPKSSRTVTIDASLSSKEELNVNSKIGSSPPSCEHKCFGCIPCEAIQVPTTSNHLGIQYANYEPEGWKCKCGPSLYTP